MTDDLITAIHTYLTTAPASGFAGQEVRVVDAWRGSDNLLWRIDAGGEDAIVKLYLDAGQARGRRQLDGQRVFAPLSLAPEPLWFDRYPDGLARQVLVYRWAAGRNASAGNRDDLAALAAGAAAIHNHDASTVRRISPHAINLNYFWRILAGGLTPALRWLEEAGCPRMAELVRAMETSASALVADTSPLWQDSLPAPIHGDLQLEHALIQGSRVRLLDWELFGLGDPALEIATFLHRERALPGSAQHKHFLASYLAHRDDAALAARIAVYDRILPLSDLAFLIDGVRKLSPAERASAEFASTVPDLGNLLRRATDDALAALALADWSAVAADEIDLLLKPNP